MDPTMNQFLANQLGITPGDGDLQPTDIAAALVSHGANPLMANLIAQMASRGPTTHGEPGEHPRDYEHEIRHLKKVIHRLQHEIASAQVMAHFIANVFGTCPNCWGLNKLCEQCEGKGKPGYTSPDLEELRAWVEPALRKGGLHIASSP